MCPQDLLSGSDIRNLSYKLFAQKMAPSTPCTESPGGKGDENWDLDKVLEFIQDAKTVPETKKKVKKKKKKLAEVSGDNLEQNNSTADKCSEESIRIQEQPEKNDTFDGFIFRLQEMLAKAGREHETKANDANASETTALKFEVVSPEEYQQLMVENTKLLLSWMLNMKRVSALETETDKLKAENEELRRTNNMKEEESKIVLKRVQKFEDEKRKLEQTLEQVGTIEKAKVAKEIQVLQEEKKEVQRQLKDEQHRVVATETALKTKECETDKLVRQIRMVTLEKVKMQSQLEELKESFSFEQSAKSTNEKDLKRLSNQVELMHKQLRCEQGLRKAAEDELADSKRQQEEELSNFLRQITVAGETILRSRQEAEQVAVGEERMHCKSSSTNARLVEKLLKQIKQPPISPADCGRFVQKLRASRGGLSGLPMEAIEEEVRKMAMEEAEVKANECPICFEPMVSNLLHCKQCNQAFHRRSKETN